MNSDWHAEKHLLKKVFFNFSENVKKKYVLNKSHVWHADMPLCNRKMQKQWVLCFPIIPRHKTDQINLTASNLEKNSVVHRLCTLKIKRTIIEDFPRPGPNVPYVGLGLILISWVK